VLFALSCIAALFTFAALHAHGDKAA
jgi:hypothetical protein